MHGDASIRITLVSLLIMLIMTEEQLLNLQWEAYCALGEPSTPEEEKAKEEFDAQLAAERAAKQAAFGNFD